MDALHISILPDGSIRTETDAVSPANHSNAEDFLKFVATLAGGESTRVKRSGTHAHDHAHEHGHDHEHH